MQALIFDSVRKLQYTTVPDPEMRDIGDVIVQVRVAAVCGSDLHV